MTTKYSQNEGPVKASVKGSKSLKLSLKLSVTIAMKDDRQLCIWSDSLTFFVGERRRGRDEGVNVRFRTGGWNMNP